MKKVKLSILICIIITLIAIIAVLIKKTNKIENVSSDNSLATEQYKFDEGFTYGIYEYVGTKIKVMVVIVDNDNGLKNVTYTNAEGEDIIIYAENGVKNKIAFDYVAERDVTYAFKSMNGLDEEKTDYLNIGSNIGNIIIWDYHQPKEFDFTLTNPSWTSIKVSGSTEDKGCAGIIKYEYRISRDGGTNWEEWITPANPLDTSYTYEGLSYWINYAFQMKAVDANLNERVAIYTKVGKLNYREWYDIGRWGGPSYVRSTSSKNQAYDYQCTGCTCTVGEGAAYSSKEWNYGSTRAYGLVHYNDYGNNVRPTICGYYTKNVSDGKNDNRGVK